MTTLNKEHALKILRLLSALEAAGLMNPNKLPDYLYDDISSAVEMMEQIILDIPQISGDEK